MLVWLLVCSATTVTAVPANGDANSCHPAELFATDNADPHGLDELRLFELQARATIALSGVAVTASTLLDGVFWSNELQQVTSERARQFHLCVVDEPTLHAAAEALRRQFDQQAVLTFDYLPREEANAVIIAVPDIDIARFRDAFVADSTAHQALLGGSVTTTDQTLIMVAGNKDLDIARRLVSAAGGSWSAATIAHGTREFVYSTSTEQAPRT